MSQVAVIFGALLIALGVYGYIGQAPSQPPPSPAATADGAEKHAPGKASPTALIPAAFGALLLICGLVGLNAANRKTAMHIAAGVALLGAVLGGGRFLSKVGPLLSGDPAVNQRAVIFTGLLGLICLIYVVLSIRSFVAARKARTPAMK